MSLIIKHATLNDWPTIQAIAQASWEANFHDFLFPEQLTFDFDREYNQERLKEILEAPEKTVTLYGNNTPVLVQTHEVGGFSEVSMDPDCETGWFINKLYIHPDAKGTGLGKAIIQHIRDEATQQGITQLKLLVNRGNSAVGFYQHMGFTITDTIDTQIGEGPDGQPYWRNDYKMILKL